MYNRGGKAPQFFTKQMARLSEVKLRITDLRTAAQQATSINYLSEMFGITNATMLYTLDLHGIETPHLKERFLARRNPKGGRRKAKMQELGLL